MVIHDGTWYVWMGICDGFACPDVMRPFEFVDILPLISALVRLIGLVSYDAAFSINAIVSLPLLDVEVWILRTLLKTLVVTWLRPDLSAHEWRELQQTRT